MHKNMHYKKIIIDIFAVTFRKEGVDWNNSLALVTVSVTVTFRKEGVDWNWLRSLLSIISLVTFRKEGVDWNIICIRRRTRIGVTFRKEGVDWNWLLIADSSPVAWSPSARKVWIEMIPVRGVVLGVEGHLPQGRCGLKYSILPDRSGCWLSHSARKVWIEISPCCNSRLR